MIEIRGEGILGERRTGDEPGKEISRNREISPEGTSHRDSVEALPLLRNERPTSLSVAVVSKVDGRARKIRKRLKALGTGNGRTLRRV